MKNKGFFTSVLIIAATVSLLGCGKAKTDTVSDTGMASAEAGSSALPVEQKQSDDENVKTDNAPQPSQDQETESTETAESNTETQVTEEESMKMLQLKISDTVVEVAWEDNESVEELRKLCEEEPLTIRMSMYGGFEQVGSLGTNLPRNDVQTTTSSGDIVLYSGNQIVVFYGSNSWAYTRLGHITDQNETGMEQLLGNGDVTLTISMEADK